MSDEIGSPPIPPFPADYRASGLLLHITSLPSPYGIGDVGPAAVKWIDKLSEAGQSWWQALPLGPTGLRRLSVSVVIVFCRQRTPDQPGLAHRRRTVAGNANARRLCFLRRR